MPQSTFAAYVDNALVKKIPLSEIASSELNYESEAGLYKLTIKTKHADEADQIFFLPDSVYAKIFKNQFDKSISNDLDIRLDITAAGNEHIVRNFK